MIPAALLWTIIAFLILAIIGVYAFLINYTSKTSTQLATMTADTNKQLADIYETVNKHIQDNQKHIDVKNPLVTRDVCDAVRDANKERDAALRKSIGGIESSLKELNTSVTQLLISTAFSAKSAEDK